jgi:hypothetical protein
MIDVCFLFVSVSTELHVSNGDHSVTSLVCSGCKSKSRDIRLFLKRSFLGAFKNLRKRTVSLLMSVYPSVRPHGTGRLPLDSFFYGV